jgi:hypothetical protein
MGKHRVYGTRYRGTGTGMLLALNALEECNTLCIGMSRQAPGIFDEEPGREEPRSYT